MSFYALCSRSLHLTQREFPWLALTAPSDGGYVPFTHVQVSLEGQEPAVATDAAVAVLARLGELLASFIGDSLTTRLLREAWPDTHSHDTELETTK